MLRLRDKTRLSLGFKVEKVLRCGCHCDCKVLLKRARKLVVVSWYLVKL